MKGLLKHFLLSQLNTEKFKIKKNRKLYQLRQNKETFTKATKHYILLPKHLLWLFSHLVFKNTSQMEILVLFYKAVTMVLS